MDRGDDDDFMSNEKAEVRVFDTLLEEDALLNQELHVCKSQNWLRRITNHLAGKIVNRYVLELCIQGLP